MPLNPLKSASHLTILVKTPGPLLPRLKNTEKSQARIGNVLDKTARFLQSSAHMKTTTLPFKHSINRVPRQLALLIPLALASLALLPQARAVCQEGCLTNNNTVLGDDALVNNTGGENNTATGFVALATNDRGSNNTATGAYALALNDTGSNNTATGFGALNSFRDGNNNIALGSRAGESLRVGSDNIDIGNVGVAIESNTIRIGTVGTQTATYIAGIANATVTGSAVYIDTTTGKLGLLSSSKRFKDGIQPMDRASEAILALKPVTFRYKNELDPKGIPQFGLVAEEVEKVNPDLVARDAEGKAFTVRYEAVNAMLLNEFLKEHCKVTELETTVVQQREEFESKITHQQKQIEALTAGLQKVSAQLELSKPAPETVNNP